MRALLRKILNQEVKNPRMSSFGSENMMGIIDAGYIPNNRGDDVDIIESIAEVLYDHMERFSEEMNRKNCLTSYNATLFHSFFKTEHRQSLIDDIQKELEDSYGHRKPGLSYGLVQQNVKDIMRKMPDKLDVNQLFFYWYTWSVDTPDDGAIVVIPLHNYIQKSMVSKVSWDDYIEIEPQ